MKFPSILTLFRLKFSILQIKISFDESGFFSSSLVLQPVNTTKTIHNKIANTFFCFSEDIISAGSWEDALATAAAGGSLPDVALIGGLPGAVAKEWALNS